MFVPGEIKGDTHDRRCRETGERGQMTIENQVQRTDIESADADKCEQSVECFQSKWSFPFELRLAQQNSFANRRPGPRGLYVFVKIFECTKVSRSREQRDCDRNNRRRDCDYGKTYVQRQR